MTENSGEGLSYEKPKIWTIITIKYANAHQFLMKKKLILYALLTGLKYYNIFA